MEQHSDPSSATRGGGALVHVCDLAPWTLDGPMLSPFSNDQQPAVLRAYVHDATPGTRGEIPENDPSRVATTRYMWKYYDHIKRYVGKRLCRVRGI